MRRRVASIGIALALLTWGLVGAAGPAAAAKPLRFFEHYVTFVCDNPGVTTSDGTVIASAMDHDEFGADASVLWWVPPDTIESTEGDATYRSSSLITDQVVTRTGYHFDADLKMEDRDFNPAGNAVISVDLIDTGVVERSTPSRSRFGNRTIRDNSFVKLFRVAGTLTINITGRPSVTFNLTNCGGPDGAPPDRAGFDVTADVRQSNPNQFVLNHSGVLVLCDVVTDDYAMNLGASADKTGTGGEATLFLPNGGMGGGTRSGIVLDATSFTGSIPVSDFDTGDPLGDAVIDVRLTRGRHTVIRTTQGSVHSKMIGYILDPSGTITFPTSPETVVDMSSCFAFDGREQQKEHAPKKK